MGNCNSLWESQTIYERYINKFGKTLFLFNNRVYGLWILGNNFRNISKYYGAYPVGYLKRIHTIFYDARKVLHLFSGSVKKGMWKNEITFDITPEVNSDIVGDAHKLSKYFDKDKFDLVLADPPYTECDAKKYGTKMINRKKVIDEVYKVMVDGGVLVWLDIQMPMYSKKRLELLGAIGLIISTNHRVRLVSLFKKKCIGG